MKRSTKLLLPAVLLAGAAAAALLLLGYGSLRASASLRLHDLCSAYIRQELSASAISLHYTFAQPEDYGMDDIPAALGSYDRQAFTDSLVQAENSLAALGDIPLQVLDEEDRLTCRLLEYVLSLALEGGRWWYYQEPLSPSLGVQAQLPILLAEYAFYRESDVQDYLALLEDVPAYFQSILAFEQEKAQQGLSLSDAVLEDVILQCRAFVQDAGNSYLSQLFAQRLDSLDGLDETSRARYTEANEDLLKTCVLPAYEALASGLESLRGAGSNSGGLFYLPEGAAYYEYLARSILGSQRPVEEIYAMLEQRLMECTLEMARLIQQDPSIIAVSGQEVYATSSPAQILDALREAAAQDFPALPAVEVDVKEVHPSLQEYASPAFYLTPPLDRMAENVIYINPAAGYGGIDLFATLAHEGYPGHLYQTVYSQSQDIPLLCALLHIGGYTEGWATYAELWSYSVSGLEETEALLLRCNKEWSLALSCLMDIGIHYYGWTLSDTAAFLEGYGIDNPDTAREVFDSIVADPANYLQYYVGCLEFEALQETAQEEWGDAYTPAAFHACILSHGCLPFHLLEEKIRAAAM